MMKRTDIFSQILLGTQLIVIISLVPTAHYVKKLESSPVESIHFAIPLRQIGLGIRRMSLPYPGFLDMLMRLSRTKPIATLILKA